MRKANPTTIGKLCKVVNKAFTMEHWVDSEKYSRVSRSKTLCGLSGKSVWQPMAAWFGAQKECKRCKNKRLGGTNAGPRQRS